MDDVSSNQNKTLSEQIGGIVHTMNNSLTVIRGFCQLLLMNKNLDAKVRKDIELIAENGKNLSDSVGQLAEISKKAINLS